MNYLRQIVGFYSTLEVKPLSARSQALWHCLMWHYNSARWRSPIVVSESVLCGELGLSHKQFLTARKELVEGGYIIHNHQQGRKPASYEILSLEE